MTEQEKAKIETRLQKYNNIQLEIDAVQNLIDNFGSGDKVRIYDVGKNLSLIKDRTIFEEFAKILDAYVDVLTVDANNI